MSIGEHGKENRKIIASTSPFFQKSHNRSGKKPFMEIVQETPDVKNGAAIVLDSEENDRGKGGLRLPDFSVKNDKFEEDLEFLEDFDDFEVDEQQAELNASRLSRSSRHASSSQINFTRPARISKNRVDSDDDDDDVDDDLNEDHGADTAKRSKRTLISGKKKRDSVKRFKDLRNDDFASHLEMQESFSSHYTIDPILNRKRNNLDQSDDFQSAPPLKSDRRFLGLRAREPKSYNIQKTFDDLGLPDQNARKTKTADANEKVTKRRDKSPDNDVKIIRVDGVEEEESDDSFVVADDHVEYEDDVEDVDQENEMYVNPSLIVANPRIRRRSSRKHLRRRSRRKSSPQQVFIQEIKKTGSDDDDDDDSSSGAKSPSAANLKILPVNMTKEEYKQSWKINAARNEEAAKVDAGKDKSVGSMSSSNSFNSVFGLDERKTENCSQS